MKILPKIGLLLLMLLVLFAAFVLPKFVQRTEPPTPKEDLAAALAAVSIEDEPAPVETSPPLVEPDEPSPLRDDSRFADFFTAIDGQDFEAAGAAFLKVSPELDPETRNQLTSQMEMAISALAPGEPGSATVTSASPPATEEFVTPVASAPDAPVPPAPVEESGSEVEMISYMASVQSGEFETARSLLATLSEKVDPATKTMLETTLATAEKKESELAASRRLLEESQAQMAKLQQESISQIQASVKELTMATKAAREAVEETARLRTEVETVKTTAAAAPAPTAPAAPVELPEPVSIAFGFDSTYLSDESKAKLDPVVALLGKEPALSLQLRGHTDGRGAADYNALLAQARCEMVRDFLLGKGIEGKRLAVVSFGKSQADGSGKSAEELRRVELIFRAE
jgi:outer membrane protein OmpA-like peptidoglycan-associated protein